MKASADKSIERNETKFHMMAIKAMLHYVLQKKCQKSTI